ncbi:MAG: uroporphyrinogen-III C-methyltransferase [Tepidisphaeraceae bacterium]
MPNGMVYLVGAGPGDPGLITVRGAKLLALADVVVYDFLASPRLLSYCPRAQTIYVGKKSASHAMPQEQINALLIENARLGRQVVRLKGGDPFVFGRGGEECQALAAAAVPFEVVPGVTAAIAAPAYAGIPVTHRDFNSSFTIVTGHEQEDPPSDIAWDALAKLPSLAFYMGAQSLPSICRRLIEHGMAPDTPAATICWGTTPRQRTVTAALADLPAAVTQAGLTAPAMTIIGKNVQLRQTIQWFERRPLLGQSVVVTRTRRQAGELSEQLESLGAAVIEAPTIELFPPRNPATVDAALAAAARFDWIIFTSANGVCAVKDRLMQGRRDVRTFGSAKIAAIGAATAKAIQSQLCLNVDLCPQQFVAEALAEQLTAGDQARGKRFLLLRAEVTRPLLTQRLAQGGAAAVVDVAVYETQPVESLPPELIEMIRHGQVQWITFTSSSTARNFIQLLGPEYRQTLQGVKLASIGPVTSQTLRELGLEPAVQAVTFDIGGLLDAIVSGS